MVALYLFLCPFLSLAWGHLDLVMRPEGHVMRPEGHVMNTPCRHLPDHSRLLWLYPSVVRPHRDEPHETLEDASPHGGLDHVALHDHEGLLHGLAHVVFLVRHAVQAQGRGHRLERA